MPTPSRNNHMCVAFGCNNTKSKVPGKTFHTFPHRKPDLLAKWIQAVHREGWRPKTSSLICADHFRPVDYQVRPGSSFALLKEGSVPTVFPVAPPHPWKPSSKKIPPQSKAVRSPPPTEEPRPLPETVEQTPVESESNRAAEQQKIHELSEQVRRLQEQVRRQQNQIEALTAMFMETQRQKTLEGPSATITVGSSGDSTREAMKRNKPHGIILRTCGKP